MERKPGSKAGHAGKQDPASDRTSRVRQSSPGDHSPNPSARSEILLAGQSRVLELLAKGAGRETVLTELVRTIERCSPGMLCSVLLLDPTTKCLRLGAAPSLPEAYNAAVDGLPIGPTAGSCGTAAFRRDLVVVEDIAVDLLWADYRAVGLKHGLRACWSQPVLSSMGDVLGTFAMYYKSPRGPTSDELELIEKAAHLAGVAIERIRADSVLRESEERFRQLAETVRLIPWEGDPQTFQFTYVGPQAVEILGYPMDSWYVEGFWTDHVHPEDRDWAVRFCRQHSTTDNHHNFEYRMIAADGRTVWIHDVVRVIQRDDRNVLRGFMIDVTDRKGAEASLRQADRLASLGTLAAGIAHEINNPLGAILLASQRALSIKDTPGGRTQLEELLNLIRDDVERCARIVSGVLKFSRQGSNDRTVTNLNDVVQSAVNLTRMYAIERRAAVNVVLSRDVTPLSMNQVEMEQVLVNLIRNAIEAGSEGVKLSVRTRQTERWVQVSVRDDGRGMTEEQKANLFDPFFTTRQPEGGTGLGLSIVHGIVAMHGGTIDVKSQPDRGTTVCVKLPVGNRPV